MVILGGGIALSNLEIFDMKYLFGFFKFAAQPDVWTTMEKQFVEEEWR